MNAEDARPAGSDYQARWLAELAHKPRRAPKKAVRVAARFVRQVCGGGDTCAAVLVEVEPSDGFEVLVDLPEGTRGEHAELIDSFILGFLDTANVALSQTALTLVRLTIKEIDTHPLDSGPRAFRMAGRIAAHRLFEESEGFGPRAFLID